MCGIPIYMNESVKKTLEFVFEKPKEKFLRTDE